MCEHKKILNLIMEFFFRFIEKAVPTFDSCSWWFCLYFINKSYFAKEECIFFITAQKVFLTRFFFHFSKKSSWYIFSVRKNYWSILSNNLMIVTSYCLKRKVNQQCECSNITAVPRQMIQSPLIRARIYSNLCYYQQVSLPL